MGWTTEQIRAIEERNTNILLSAAAGSGKTTVLVERVLRLILEENVDVDRMLVVTFTRAAASDMCAKLNKKLSEKAAEGDGRCREQLLKLDRASISTMHAFCADFLRANFESAGVDPAFRILDDAIVSRLREEALSEALEEAYAEGGEALLNLDYGRGPGPTGVRGALEILFSRMEERPDPEEWLKQACRCDDEMIARWFYEIMEAAKRSVRTAIVQLREVLTVNNCPFNYETAVKKDIEILEAILEIDEYDNLFRALNEFSPTRAAGGRRSDSDPEAVEEVKRLRETAKRSLADLRIKSLPVLTAREDAQKLAPQIERLSRIALRAEEIYEAKKAEQSGLTYADLEHKTLHALQNRSVAAGVRERFDYIFVDEYQDTSDLQEAVIRMICRDNNVFMVGDVKQSIYRFRLAEPRLFLEKYADYGRAKGGLLLPLTRNFRSRPGILNFTNMVFERIMTGGDAEIEYDEIARLNPGDPEMKDVCEPAVEIHLIDNATEKEEVVDEATEKIGELRAIEREGILIAKLIHKAMEQDPTLKYRDFAILTRSKSAPFSAIAPMLLTEGIPAYADGASGYYDAIEIIWMISLLRLIDNRRSDVELIGVLRSPAVGLSAEDLAKIRIAARNVAYVDAATLYAQSEKDVIADKLRNFFEMLRSWQLKAGSMALGEFVRLTLDESGFYTYVGALPGGAQRQANLDQFVNIACNFDRQISGSLSRFLQHMEYLRLKGDADAAHLLSENDNVVRMMTIHKSKGLEFRVVIGAQLSHTYRVEKSNAPLSAHRDLGVGMSYMDLELRTRRLTLPQAAIMERQKREDAAEEMRILYVLLTRAKERLMLIGGVRDCNRMMKRWKALSAAPFAATSHMDLIMAARWGAEMEGKPLYSNIHIHTPWTLISGEPAETSSSAKTQLETIMAHPENYINPEMEKWMNWRYPDSLSAKKPLKLTVSGLLRELEGPEEIPVLLERPAFMAEEARRMTGVERGTAYHRAMQILDFAPLTGLSGRDLSRAVRIQLDALTEARKLTEIQREAVHPARLARFLETSVGIRLRTASEMRREWSFNAMLRVSEVLTPEEAGRFLEDEILVQGTIDCCFIENGEWVLLDYKTDRVDDPEAVREHYKKQLHAYALALESITGIRVKQRLLCMISADCILEV